MAAHLLGHLADALHAGAVQMTVVLPGFNEPVALDVLFHLFPGGHKMIVSPVHLVIPLRPRCVCQMKDKQRQMNAHEHPVMNLRIKTIAFIHTSSDNQRR